jgi:hypothetical protein
MFFLFLLLQGDIYGSDLLGGAADAQNQPQQPTTIDTSTLSTDELKTALQEWHSIFQEEQQEGGVFSGITGTIQPITVLNELRRAIASEKQARAESAALRQRLAGAAAETAARIQEDVMLRKELLAARTSTDPSVLQLRQLLLEPVVNREFDRLSSATATATLEATNLRNDRRLLNDIANNPKGPLALAAEIRSLKEKCDALEKVNEEGEKERIERALTTAKSQLEEMRHRYGELEDHTHSLDTEIEILQKDLVNAERKLSAIGSSGGSERGGGGGGGGGAGGRAPYYQQQGGWNRGPVPPPPTQHQQYPPPPSSGGGGGRGYYTRGPQGQQQQSGMGSGGGKRPRDF